MRIYPLKQSRDGWLIRKYSAHRYSLLFYSLLTTLAVGPLLDSFREIAQLRAPRVLMFDERLSADVGLPCSG